MIHLCNEVTKVLRQIMSSQKASDDVWSQLEGVMNGMILKMVFKGLNEIDFSKKKVWD